MTFKETIEWFKSNPSTEKQNKDCERMRNLWNNFCKKNNIINDFEDEDCDLKPEFIDYLKHGTDTDTKFELDDIETDENIEQFFAGIVNGLNTKIIEMHFYRKRNKETNSADLILNFTFLKEIT